MGGIWGAMGGNLGAEFGGRWAEITRVCLSCAGVATPLQESGTPVAGKTINLIVKLALSTARGVGWGKDAGVSTPLQEPVTPVAGKTINLIVRLELSTAHGVVWGKVPVLLEPPCPSLVRGGWLSSPPDKDGWGVWC